ncbi:hypothetical protein Dcar01_02379 [Deinococcus carri]|uniref:Uncharacterized protein n=1 Tax=Deinococcus carri TaxID=1211323 RepID=A0ABP9WAZ2_9DEIO
MEDTELLRKTALMHEKLLGMRATLHEQGAAEEGSPLHDVHRQACVQMREAQAIHDELAHRLGVTHRLPGGLYA